MADTARTTRAALVRSALAFALALTAMLTAGLRAPEGSWIG